MRRCGEHVGFALSCAPGANVMKLCLVFMFSVVLALSGRAHAQDASLKKAQEAFDQAQMKYLAGDYDAAADGFKAAYEARAFPQFLYNIGACFHMKGKKTGDAESYSKAIEYYQRYLKEDPQAADKSKVEKSIAVLESEVERLKTEAPKAGDPPPPPSKEVENLGEVAVRGLIVIESEPQGASLYIDGKDKGEVARTPWSGSMEGEHTYLVEKRGYKSKEGRMSPDPSRLLVVQIVLSEEDYLGWVEVKSNVPGADVYVDDKNVGAIGKTPYSGNFKPGKHTFYVVADGYEEYVQELEVFAGESSDVTATLKGSPVGYLNLRGAGIDKSEILIDGKVLCERGPCRKPVKQGTHVVTVRRPGYKPYSARVDVQARTEISMRAQLSKRPGRGDAIAAGVVSMLFAGGGIYLGLQAKGLEDDLRSEIDAGNPPPDDEDPRVMRGKYFAIGADVAFGVSGIVALTALYYTFRDKGAPSTGQIDVRAIAGKPEFRPVLTPESAGVAMEVSW